VDTTRGNPLLSEQLLAAFNDHSVDPIPASLQGLLAMRLDRLGPGEQDLLRCAAVVGTDCWDGALVRCSQTKPARSCRRALAREGRP
jgi:hypothetical protein